MFRLTRQTDYALVLLAQMVQEGSEGVANARDLATRTQIPQPMVSKTLKRLAREGLIVSTRGAAGGYRLGRVPESIPVAEVIARLEGPIALTECSGDHGQGSCSLEGCCLVSSPLQRLSRVVAVALEGISLADLAQPSPTFPAKQSSDSKPAIDPARLFTLTSS